MIDFFHTTLYQPLYNGLVFLISVMPWYDVGLAVLALTILVKLILLPLSEKAVATQLAMKRFEPELNNIKIQYKNDREGQAQAVLKFYKDHKINPVASFLVVLIQMPIIISLYYVFYAGGLPDINPDLLYSFTKVPETVNMHFLNVLDIGEKSILLAVLVGATQFVQMKLAMPPMPPKEKKDGPPSLKDEMARSLNMQMRYVMPALLAFVALQVSGAVSLYWTMSNLFAIAQELYMRKKFAFERAEIASHTVKTVKKTK
ncbi:MAG: YidC/Oxa1 family membrane protein insertase [Candidatus Taylorbacteria bacterium]|nr:YidC/Oxa1 family membrane protein insertase [Candidatus Taylorbacteria bacterium]